MSCFVSQKALLSCVLSFCPSRLLSAASWLRGRVFHCFVVFFCFFCLYVCLCFVSVCLCFVSGSYVFVLPLGRTWYVILSYSMPSCRIFCVCLFRPFCAASWLRERATLFLSFFLVLLSFIFVFVIQYGMSFHLFSLFCPLRLFFPLLSFSSFSVVLSFPYFIFPFCAFHDYGNA